MTSQNRNPIRSSIIDNAIQHLEAGWMLFTSESIQRFTEHAQKERTLAFNHLLRDVRIIKGEDTKIADLLSEVLNSKVQVSSVSIDPRSVNKELKVDNSIYISTDQIMRKIDLGEVGKGLSVDHYLVAEQNGEELVSIVQKKQKRKRTDLIEYFCDAFANSGAVIRLSKNTVIKEPILCLVIKPAGATSVNKVIIRCDEGSDATILLQINDQNKKDLGGCVTSLEVELGLNAKLKLITVQNLSQRTISLTAQTATLMKDACLDWTSIELGGQTVNNDIKVIHAGEGCTSTQNGFFICGEGQEYTTHSKQLHLAKGTHSRFLLKGIQLGNGNSTWKGNIFVSEGAEKTNSYQANRNLILSSNAQAVSIPGLEILSDDVKCSHGATISNLDEDELFYLLSRGISSMDAVQLLALGYVEEVLKNVNNMQFYDGLFNLIKDYLPMELTIPEASNARMI